MAVLKWKEIKKGSEEMLLEQMPDLRLQDVDGNTVSLEEYRGSKTLVFMWASW
ncbi:MAG TPA: redoxin domain-containing protein [Bacillales bacterium]